VRIKLLTPGDTLAGPKLCSYSGRHLLRNWVCTIAVRTAIDLHRARRRDTVEPDADRLAASNDPELLLLRARYQSAFAAALATATNSIDLRQRRVMRLFFRDGFNYRQIGRVFNVDETTARRWLLQTKELLVRCVRAELEHQLQLRTHDIAQLYVLVRSRMEVSLTRLFASAEDHGIE
jgi:RNA polymerase sigma-70 factor